MLENVFTPAKISCQWFGWNWTLHFRWNVSLPANNKFMTVPVPSTLSHRQFFSSWCWLDKHIVKKRGMFITNNGCDLCRGVLQCLISWLVMGISSSLQVVSRNYIPYIPWYREASECEMYLMLVFCLLSWSEVHYRISP